MTQSLGPALYAASFVDDGIWTISCAGKPMRLPIPGQAPGAHTASQPDDGSSRHCLICSNASATDAITLFTVVLQLLFADTTDTIATAQQKSAGDQTYKPYHPRAPPFFSLWSKIFY